MKIAIAGDSAGAELAHVLAEHLKARHDVAELITPENDVEKFYAHLSDARLRAELEAAFIASPYPGVQHEASQARSLDRAELAAHLRELAQTLES